MLLKCFTHVASAIKRGSLDRRQLAVLVFCRACPANGRSLLYHPTVFAGSQWRPRLAVCVVPVCSSLLCFAAVTPAILWHVRRTTAFTGLFSVACWFYVP